MADETLATEDIGVYEITVEADTAQRFIIEQGENPRIMCNSLGVALDAGQTLYITAIA